MPGTKRQWKPGRLVLELARSQHWVVARRQLLASGFSSAAIEHLIATGRLHPVARGIYAVGRPAMSGDGEWMAALLACGPGAVLSHQSAAALWGMRLGADGPVHVIGRGPAGRGRPEIVVHRLTLNSAQITERRGMLLTTPARTLVDLAASATPEQIDKAVGEADRLDLISPDQLRSSLPEFARVRGVAVLRRHLDRKTFVLAHSELERLFGAIVTKSDLPLPESQSQLGRARVDYYWPELGLVVEVDGLRYHRTAAQQAKDTERDHIHLAAGRTVLRFTYEEVKHRPGYVRATLIRVARRLSAAGSRAAH